MKNFTQLLIITVIFLFSIITFSCDTQENWLFVDEETKSYCYFENGASYVYKDSVSGNIDSIKLNNNWNVPEVSRHGYEYYEADITDWNDNKIGNCFISVKGDQSSSMSFSYWSIPESVISYPYITYSSCTEETNNTFCTGDYGELINIYSQFIIEDNTYSDVKKFKKTSGTIGNNFEYFYFYWAKNVGLIKCERYNESDSILSNINLIEYEIYN